MRNDYDLFYENRRNALINNLNSKSCLIEFALSCYFINDLYLCYEILNLTLLILQGKFSKFEISEILMAQAKCLEEERKYHELINFLIGHKEKILDKKFYFEKLSFSFLNVDKIELAKSSFIELIKSYSENLNYYYDYIRIFGKQSVNDFENNSFFFLELFRNILNSEKLPSCFVHLELNLCKIEEFQKIFEKYLLSGLSKGIPSLCKNIKNIIRNHQKSEIINQTLLLYYDAFKPIKADPNNNQSNKNL